MCRYKQFLFLFFVFISALPAFAQTERNPVFFIAPVFEANGYGRFQSSMGGGLYLGADGGVTIGLKTMYFVSGETPNLASLEVLLCLRVYILEFEKAQGLYGQISFGPVLYAGEAPHELPARAGSFSAGLTVGWRQPFGKYFFIEPEIRGGFPFGFGAGLSMGVRF